jgi:hypothetical protein
MNQRPQDKPAVPFGKPAAQTQAKRTPQPEVRTREEISFTAQELEKNISRLSPTASFPSHQLAQNFDALNYASISLSSPPRNESQTPPSEPAANTADIDPYIDPSELREPYLDSLRDTNHDSPSPRSKIKLPAVSKSNERGSPVTSFPAHLPVVKPHKSHFAKQRPEATSLEAELKTTQSPFSEPNQQAASRIEDKKSQDVFDNNEVFLARTGDIIKVSSEDGFDHIDLACYDINLASISSNTIRINDAQNGSFEIHFVGIDYAIFANGIKIQLDSAD